MKIGELDIKKAYFGAKELTPTNAYLGDVPIKKNEGIPNDEIWYTSSDGQVINPYDTSALPAIVSNTYNDGKGVIKFASEVSSIGSNAFYRCMNLSSIEIPNSITSIGNSAFGTCLGLSSIIIPNNVTSIGEEAFYNCRALTSVTIGNSVTIIKSYSFDNCYNLTSISYTGTISKWNAITKNSNWYTGDTVTVVHCSDGDVAL